MSLRTHPSCELRISDGDMRARVAWPFTRWGTSMLTQRRMGELEPWIDENFVRSIWYNMGETVNVKMIRDKFSG